MNCNGICPKLRIRTLYGAGWGLKEMKLTMIAQHKCRQWLKSKDACLVEVIARPVAPLSFYCWIPGSIFQVLLPRDTKLDPKSLTIGDAVVLE